MGGERQPVILPLAPQAGRGARGGASSRRGLDRLLSWRFTRQLIASLNWMSSAPRLCRAHPPCLGRSGVQVRGLLQHPGQGDLLGKGAALLLCQFVGAAGRAPSSPPDLCPDHGLLIRRFRRSCRRVAAAEARPRACDEPCENTVIMGLPLTSPLLPGSPAMSERSLPLGSTGNSIAPSASTANFFRLSDFFVGLLPRDARGGFQLEPPNAPIRSRRVLSFSASTTVPAPLRPRRPFAVKCRRRVDRLLVLSRDLDVFGDGRRLTRRSISGCHGGPIPLAYHDDLIARVTRP